ncbi:MAG: TetR/AcrR family transcriptional regulator [Spirochaetes bacterium]|nr:TetR/AcrR family transcriptional regulator [Spirochaetota bacterium]
MITYEEFLRIFPHNTEELAGEIYDNEFENIQIKKRHIAIKNLTRIFEATLSLSNSKGFRSMSLRDLSKEVGITMGGLYLYFKSKDDLIDLIENQSIRMTKRIIMDIDIASLPPRQALRDVIQYYLYLSESNRQWLYFLYMETKNFSLAQKKKAMDLELFVEDIFVDILDRGVSRGDFRIGNTRISASMIVALLMEWFLKRHKYYKRNVSIDQYVAYVIESIERIVLPGIS